MKKKLTQMEKEAAKLNEMKKELDKRLGDTDDDSEVNDSDNTTSLESSSSNSTCSSASSKDECFEDSQSYENENEKKYNAVTL